eukprot:9472435-Pyramimonas_sp.AAC.1
MDLPALRRLSGNGIYTIVSMFPVARSRFRTDLRSCLRGLTERARSRFLEPGEHGQLGARVYLASP